jgi:predicted GNAT superfamily acetyltransferase
LENIIDQDVPSTDVFEAAGIEEYAKFFKDPLLLPDGWFIALDNTKCVGLSVLWPNAVRKDLLMVGITGVIPSHRRRGIGTALKLKSINYAQVYGAKIIETDNEGYSGYVEF